MSTQLLIRENQQATLKIEVARVLKPLLKPARYKGAHGGRSSMKSHFFAQLGVSRALGQPGFRMVCLREVQKDLKESAKRLIENKIRANGVEHKFGIYRDHIEGPGKGLFLFQGLSDHTAESIKSLEDFDVAWNEEGQTLSERSVEYLRPTIRKPGSEIWTSWNPRFQGDPIDQLLRGPNPPKNSIVVETNWKDNPWFTGEMEEERLHDFKYKPDRYGHIWEGDYEPQAVGSLWTRAMIHGCRRHNDPDLEKIIVAVDPAVSNEEGSDEHGIIVAGLGADKKGYILEDGSLKGSPNQCARRVISMYDKWQASEIVYEKNNGGKWIKETFRSVRHGLPVREVWASRGKYIRAEPIASLYETGVIHHVGTFKQLEDQLCLMVSGDYAGEGSPDRACASVWALSWLFRHIVSPKEDKEPRKYHISDQNRKIN